MRMLVVVVGHGHLKRLKDVARSLKHMRTKQENRRGRLFHTCTLWNTPQPFVSFVAFCNKATHKRYEPHAVYCMLRTSGNVE